MVKILSINNVTIMFNTLNSSKLIYPYFPIQLKKFACDAWNGFTFTWYCVIERTIVVIVPDPHNVTVNTLHKFIQLINYYY